MILDRGQKTFVADVEARPIKVPERRPGARSRRARLPTADGRWR